MLISIQIKKVLMLARLGQNDVVPRCMAWQQFKCLRARDYAFLAGLKRR